MSDLDFSSPDWTAIAKARAEVTALLLAKGLKEGHGKWFVVFNRHLSKRVRRVCT